MILHRLVEYADTRMELPPVMYGAPRVRWRIELTPEGEFVSFFSLGGDKKENKAGERVKHLPQIDRTSGIKANLLVDNAEYVLGIPKPNSKPERVVKCHQAFMKLAERCAEETEEPSVEAVVRFLREWSSDGDITLPEDFDPNLNLSFRVGMVEPAKELESVQRFWADYNSGSEVEGEQSSLTCLVTGQIGSVEETLPGNIKGIPNGQTSGIALVSANKEAFTSYGLKRARTAPISKSAGEKFNKALNALLSDDKSRVRVGPLAYVFWTRQESGFDFVNFMSQPEAESVKNLLASPVTGSERSDVGANEFYALALSASGGRAVVRDWLETTVPRAEDNLKRWFRAQKIVDPYGEEARPLGLYPLAASAYRDASKEMTSQVPASLLRAAIKGAEGGQVPLDLLAKAVRRNRVEGDVNRQRAALMKLVLSYGRGDMELTETAERLEKLDMENGEPAYHCGRMLAQLEALQVAAIPGVKATIVDRYYGAASSTPASVFGTLMRNSTSHLGKVRKERPAVGAAIQDRIGEIATSIGSDFPNTLNMRQQAIFALGYYHQRAQNRADARAAREARDSREES